MSEAIDYVMFHLIKQKLLHPVVPQSTVDTDHPSYSGTRELEKEGQSKTHFG